MAGDLYFGSVTFLSHFDGTDGSTTFTDVKGHTMTAAGDAKVSIAQSKFGGASAYFDGTGDYIAVSDSADWDLPGNFTIEGWAYWETPSDSKNAGVISLDGANFSFDRAVSNSGALRFYMDGTSLLGSVPSLNAWHHVAVTREGNTVRLFLDGVYQNSATYSSSIVPTGLKLGNNLVGYLDDVRITKGVARYVSTSGFTVPTTPFPDQLDTASLVTQIRRIIRPTRSFQQPIHHIGI